MTQTIQIELTDTQFKGLEYAALSPTEWAENAVTERARIANDEIVQQMTPLEFMPTTTLICTTINMECLAYT